MPLLDLSKLSGKCKRENEEYSLAHRQRISFRTFELHSNAIDVWIPIFDSCHEWRKYRKRHLGTLTSTMPPTENSSALFDHAALNVQTPIIGQRIDCSKRPRSFTCNYCQRIIFKAQHPLQQSASSNKQVQRVATFHWRKRISCTGIEAEAPPVAISRTVQ